MSRTMKTLVTLLLCVAMLASAAVVTAVADEEKPVVTLLIQAGSGIVPPEKNFVIDTINETLGIDFRPTIVATYEDYQTKFATLAAAGELPDIIYANRVDLIEMVENDVVLPLDDLLAEYGQDILADKEGSFGSFTFDGKIYGIPNASAEGMQAQMLGLRKDWLENLGLEVPTTLDELYDVLYAFTYNDPDKNGQNDTIGLCICMANDSSWGYGIASAYGISRKYSNLVDDQVVPSLLHPKFLDMIKFYRSLYENGLMEPDFATMPWIDCANKLWNGGYGAIAFGPIGTSNNWASRYTDPNASWVYCNIVGPDGISGFDNPNAAMSSCAAINANCKNPEAAMRLLNFAVTDAGNSLVILGLEGVHYKDNGDGTVSYLPPYSEDITLQRNEGGYALAGLLGSMKNCATMKTLNKVTSEALTWSTENQLPNVVVLYETPEIEIEYGSILGDLIKDAFCSLIVTSGDVEAEYNSYVEKYLKSGGEEWIEQATAIYNAQQN